MFSGTKSYALGLDEEGYSANHVETETIVQCKDS